MMQGKHIAIGTAAVLAGGVVWAGAVMLSPEPSTGTEPSHLREMALKAEAPMPAAPSVEVPQVAVSPAAEATPAPTPQTPVVTRTEEQPRQPAVQPAVVSRRSAPALPNPVATPTPTPPQDDAVRSLALTGVTHQGGEDQALLVHLDTRQREAVRLGDRAFGFTVRKIEPESVVLARGSDQYTLRLGDKQVPVVESSVSLTSADEGNQGGFGRGRGNGGFGDRGGFGGNDADRERRRAEFFARFGGRNGERPSFNNASGFSGSSEANTFSSGGDGERSDRDRQRDGNSGRSFQPAFQPGMNPGFMMNPFWGGGRQTGQQSFTNASTTNPQTARRRGSALVGGASNPDTPDPINNPQTQRRLGNTSGPAFGQDQSTFNGRNGFNNRTGTSGSFGRGSNNR